MTSRPVSDPPELRGFDHERHLGSGGFADVFLYRDNAANRQVAVKVLLEDALAPGVRRQFESEAKLMGTLSSHPSIVTVFQTGIADDGRPYLVMEYCPRPSLGARFRARPLPLPEALDLTVDICGAVETAHRAGILHRDIKPANILVTEYGRAVLTDFGIAATVAAQHENQGMSVPWAPPEFADGHGWPASDVWSLAATLYSLLAGRAPFEIPGGDNSAAAMLWRSAHDPLPPLQRSDVPPALMDVLAVAMAKDPAHRYASALDLGRALQRVQLGLSLPETKIYVPTAEVDDGPSAAGPEAETDGTRMGGPRTGPTPPPVQPAAPPRDYIAVAPERVPDEAELAATALPGGFAAPPGTGPAPAPAPPPARGRGALTWIGVAVGAAVLAGVGIVVWQATGSDAPDAAPDHLADAVPTADAVAPAAAAAVPDVVDGAAVARDGGVLFTWTNPDPEPGDVYRWVRSDGAGTQSPHQVEQTEVFVPGTDYACVEVSIVRETGRTARGAVEVCGP